MNVIDKRSVQTYFSLFTDTEVATLNRRSVRSQVGSLVREVYLTLSLLRRRRDCPTVLFLPSQGRECGASNLRAYSIADKLRVRAWNAYTCPKHLTLRQRLRLIRRIRPDVLLMQTARHPLNRPRFYPGHRVVFDLDDADYLEKSFAPSVIEAVRDSAATIAGSRAVAAFCRQHNPDVSIVWTGSPPWLGTLESQVARKPIVTWAAAGPMGYPDEAAFVLQVLTLLKPLAADFTFRIYGDDHSGEYRTFAAMFEQQAICVETRPYMPYAKFLESLQETAVGMAPLIDMDNFSGGKSFGKILAYLDRGVPVVTHPVVDHPLFFSNGRNGYMARSAQEWAELIAALLIDPNRRQRIADAARTDFRKRLSIDVAAQRVEKVLARVIANSPKDGVDPDGNEVVNP